MTSHRENTAPPHVYLNHFAGEGGQWFLFACIEVDEATGITLKTGWLDLCRAARGHG